MAAATAIPEVLELTATSNPYLEFYNEYCKTSKQDLFKVFDPSINEKKRRKMYKALDVSVAMKYAWAIPDERALRIIKHYGPIVEMGAGTGYWGRLLQLRGVDIICYDLHVADDDENDAEAGDEEEDSEGDEEEEEGDEEEEDDDDEQEERGEEAEGEDQEEEEDEEDEAEAEADSDEEVEVEVEQIYWMDVLKGTPKALRKHADRTLLLCYPDDFEDSSESMALQALHNYTGEYVIHVGEMFSQTLCLPGPWGRTSSSDFQVHLASVYHKVLQVPLPSWHSSIDALTVWKRTKTSITDNCFYAFIPEDERLDLVEACASTRFLLEEPASKNVVTPQSTAAPKRKHEKQQKQEEKKEMHVASTTTEDKSPKKKSRKRHKKATSKA